MEVAKRYQNSCTCYKTDYNAKIIEIEGKIPSVTGLATSVVVNAVENKITNVSNLVKKADYGAKILYIEVRYCTTSDYNKFTYEILDTKIKEKELVNKFVSGFIDNSDLNKKIVTLATIPEVKAE